MAFQITSVNKLRPKEGTVNIFEPDFSNGIAIGAHSLLDLTLIDSLSFPLDDPSKSRIFRFDLNTFGPTISTDLDVYVSSAVFDTINGYAYYATNDSPSKILKVDVSTMQVVDSITLMSGETDLDTAEIDESNGFAYFVVRSSDGSTVGSVVKININPISFARVGILTFSGPAADTSTFGNVDSCIDVSGGKLYVTTVDAAIKIDLATFTEDAKLTSITSRSCAFNPTKNELYCGSIGGTSSNDTILPIIASSMTGAATIEMTVSGPGAAGARNIRSISVDGPNAVIWAYGVDRFTGVGSSLKNATSRVILQKFDVSGGAGAISTSFTNEITEWFGVEVLGVHFDPNNDPGVLHTAWLNVSDSFFVNSSGRVARFKE